MRIRETVVAAGFLSIFSMGMLAPREAAAQPVVPIAPRDGTWGTISNVTMVLGAGIVTLMPRVYYNDPEATVGWKARWHISVLAPAMSLTALTLLVDGPIRNAIKTPRPGCNLDNTAAALPGSECESYAMPSTQSYASWGSTGFGTGVFLVDTVKYSNAKFNAGSFIGNVGVPLVLSVLTSVGRSVGSPPDTFAHEDVGSIVVGSLTGFASGALVGVAYSLLQRPNCGYGGSLVSAGDPRLHPVGEGSPAPAAHEAAGLAWDSPARVRAKPERVGSKPDRVASKPARVRSGPIQLGGMQA